MSESESDRPLRSTAFFEKKISLSPSEMNRVKHTSVVDMLRAKAVQLLEGKCTEHGYVIPNTLTYVSQTMGYFESARFTGDVNYYVKLHGEVIYPVDGAVLEGTVIRKNKMGVYVSYRVNGRDAIHVQVPRDLHLGDNDRGFDTIAIGDTVSVRLKRSKFSMNDDVIIASGIFLSNHTAEDRAKMAMDQQEADE